MSTLKLNFDSFLDFINYYLSTLGDYNYASSDFYRDSVSIFKKGNKIHIKKKNKGKFTEYCGGTVTNECIQKGKHSSNPITRKRATFAESARKWKN